MSRPVAELKEWAETVVNGADPVTIFEVDSLPHTEKIVLSGYSSAAVKLVLYQRKNAGSGNWHAKSEHILVAGATDGNNVKIIDNLFGPAKLTIENTTGANAAAEIQYSFRG